MYSRFFRHFVMLLPSVLLMTFGQDGLAETFKVKSCKVEFETTGSPVLVRIKGASKKECAGNIIVDGGNLKSGELTMDLSDIETGIPLRNKHLRENYLHIDKFPIATLKLTSAANAGNQLAGKAKGVNEFGAILTLHGKDAALKNAEYSISSGKTVTAKFTVDLVDHGVPYPSFMGVKVVDRVHLTVTLEI